MFENQNNKHLKETNDETSSVSTSGLHPLINKRASHKPKPSVNVQSGMLHAAVLFQNEFWWDATGKRHEINKLLAGNTTYLQNIKNFILNMQEEFYFNFPTENEHQKDLLNQIFLANHKLEKPRKCVDCKHCQEIIENRYKVVKPTQTSTTFSVDFPDYQKMLDLLEYQDFDMLSTITISKWIVDTPLYVRLADITSYETF